jgi:hypothetical protein
MGCEKAEELARPQTKCQGCLKGFTGVNPMTEPTKEELMAWVAELEAQSISRKRGALQFKVSEKVESVSTGLAGFP